MEHEIIQTPEEFLRLENDWRELYAHNKEVNFYLSFDWFYAVLFLAQARPGAIYVIVFRDHGQPIAIIPAWVRRRPWLNRRAFAALQVASLELIGNVYSPMRGCLVKSGWEVPVAEALLSVLLHEGSQDWDVFCCEALSPADAFVRRLIDTIKAARLPVLRSDEFVNAISDLKCYDDSEVLYRSMRKSHREDIQRRINRLTRDGDFEIVLIDEGQHIVDEGITHYYDVYANSWKQREGDPGFHRHLAAYLAERSALCLFLLYFRASGGSSNRAQRFDSYRSRVERGRPIPRDYVPIASNMYIVSGRQAFWLKTAYRQDYAKYSPGTVLIWFSMKYLFESRGVRLIDHQQGDEPYKMKWLGDVRETRFRFITGNPRSLRGRVELWLRGLQQRMKAPTKRQLASVNASRATVDPESPKRSGGQQQGAHIPNR